MPRRNAEPPADRKPFIPDPDIGPEADHRRREAVKALYRDWETGRRAALGRMPPRVADEVRTARWAMFAAGDRSAVDLRACEQRAVSKERVRRHGALDPDTAWAQHQAIRAEWGIKP